MSETLVNKTNPPPQSMRTHLHKRSQSLNKNNYLGSLKPAVTVLAENSNVASSSRPSFRNASPAQEESKIEEVSMHKEITKTLRTDSKSKVIGAIHEGI